MALELVYAPGCGQAFSAQLVPLQLPPSCKVLPLLGMQALKANPQGAPKELSLKSNYVTKFGQVLRMLRVLRCAVGAGAWGAPAVEE